MRFTGFARGPSREGRAAPSGGEPLIERAQVLVVGVGELTRRDVGPVAFQLLAQRLRLAGAGQQPLDQREALGVALRFIGRQRLAGGRRGVPILVSCLVCRLTDRSEEHTSELQSLMRISYAVFCLK